LRDFQNFVTMAEPDELYTLRAQFALGHYGLALQESKQVARRPLSVALQAEREEYAVRALIALRQFTKIEEGDRPGKAFV
jgi:coatomer subunit epsilon